MNRILFFIFCLSASLQSFAQDKHLTVYFPFAASELESSERLKLLYFLSDSLPTDKKYTIQIRGYCDFIDNDEVNNQLSLVRAESVASILMSNGIRKEAILSVKGFGEKKADNRKTSEAERSKQRRVELDFIYVELSEDIVEKEITKEEKKEAYSEEVVRVIQGDTVEDEKGVRYKGRYLVEKDLELHRFDEGDSIVLVRLMFQPGRHVLLKESLPILYRLTSQLADNPNIHILIVGHVCCANPRDTDGMDNDTQRYELGYNRAKEIYEYLISQGISPDRLNFGSMGPRQKLYPEERNAREQQGNRRVEIVVTQK